MLSAIVYTLCMILMIAGFVATIGFPMYMDQLFAYLKQRREDKLAFKIKQKELEIQLIEAQRQVALDKAKLDDAYWRDLSGLPKENV